MSLDVLDYSVQISKQIKLQASDKHCIRYTGLQPNQADVQADGW